ncbi:hypothetical protein F4859DRAFT_476231 [Xylaria cf. heliscus]|nr:hypothetical protein F4859DRAFT_476231 [Xylaria cf. heliscus]
MESQGPQSPPKRIVSWVSDTTYHPVHEDDDAEKNLITPDNGQDADSPQEKPKIALRKRFSWLHPLVHLLPVGVTLAILQLTFRGVYWDDDTRYDARWQAVLQFPAKLHEILIVGSLSAIVLHIFRRMLVSANGIPLGLMVGAFQMGSAEYLISKSYVKPFRHSLAHQQYKTFFVALALGLSILYSFLVGPASAGALIPILAWWEMRTPFNNSLPLTSYLSRSHSELYPLTLGKASINSDCLKQDAFDYQGCPAEGWRVFNDWAWTRQEERYRYNVTQGQHYNPTMESSFSGQAQREIVTRLTISENSSTAAALSGTLHSSALALTDAFWHYVSSNVVGKVNRAKRPKFIVSKKTPVSIPLVQVQCDAYDYEISRLGRDDPYLTFKTGAMNDLSSPPGPDAYSTTKWIVPDNTWNFTRPWNATNITWVDASAIKGTGNEPLHASLTAVVAIPVGYYGTYRNGTRYYWQGSKVTPCVIDARWATTDVTFDTGDNVLTTSLTDWLNTADFLSNRLNVKAELSKWEVSEPISLSADWAATLNSHVLDTDEDSMYRDLHLIENFLQNFVSLKDLDDGETILEFFPSTGQATANDTANDVAIMLGTVISDWLSRSTFRGTSFMAVLSADKAGNVSTINLLNQRTHGAYGTTPVSTFEDRTPVIFDVQRYGWGYGINSQNSDTIWFSIVILLIHVLLVVVYFSYSFVFWCRARGWTSNAWGTIGEFVALAVVSPSATELRNSGAGINRSKTWVTPLRIREGSEHHDQLELVVGNRDGTIVPTANMVKLNKEYS